jgi:uncharacterized protein YlbG (UPF0298 family)
MLKQYFYKQNVEKYYQKLADLNFVKDQLAGKFKVLAKESE